MADEEEDPTFEEENEEIGGGAEGGQGKRKRLFSKELRCMMYGFGDDQNPYTESVDILEDLVIEFITEMSHGTCFFHVGVSVCQRNMMASSSRSPSIQLLIKGAPSLPNTEDSKQGV
ncbi:transcription initiation factor TFIID subunit 13 isoform X2 [Camelus bactrianus]|uniref:Transcription initiation factor TFIID subunit 13 isoform X2 n=1 Tax=Camelus bactrianus TaxID=9837 RepID=A0AC58QV88_CAMBA